MMRRVFLVIALIACTVAGMDAGQSFRARRRTAADNSPPPPDTTAPTITITSPTSDGAATTNTATTPIGGTASDNTGVSFVECECTTCTPTTFTITGTTTWQSTSDVTMTEGDNILTCTVEDVYGNTASDILALTYDAPDAPAGLVTTHPRLLLTPAGTGGPNDVDDVAARIAANADGFVRTDFQTHITYLVSRIGAFATMTDVAQLNNMAAAMAFAYAIGPVTNVTYGAYGQGAAGPNALGAEAIIALQRLDTLNAVSQIGAGFAYDWTYNLMTTGQRDALAEHLRTTVDPPATDRSLFHGPGVQESANWMIIALAFAGDASDDGSGTPSRTGTEMLKHWDQRTSSYDTAIVPWSDNDGDSDCTVSAANPGGYIDAANFAAGHSEDTRGGHLRGWRYDQDANNDGWVPHMLAIPIVQEAWRTSHNISMSAMYSGGCGRYVRSQTISLFYNSTPFGTEGGSSQNGEFRPFYRNIKSGYTTGLDTSNLYTVVIAANTMFSEIDSISPGLAAWMYKDSAHGGDGRVDRVDVGSYVTNRHLQATWFFATYNPNVTAASPTALDLPLSRWFSGVGEIVTCGPDWSDNTTCMMQHGQPWFKEGYAAEFAGNIEINRKGAFVRPGGTGIHHLSEAAWAYNLVFGIDPAVAPTSTKYGMGEQMIGPSDVTTMLGTSTSLLQTNVYRRDAGGWKSDGSEGRIALLHGSETNYIDYTYQETSKAWDTDNVTLDSRQVVRFNRTLTTQNDFIVVLDRRGHNVTDMELRAHWWAPAKQADTTYPYTSVAAALADSNVSYNPEATCTESFSRPVGTTAGHFRCSNFEWMQITNTEGGASTRGWITPLDPSDRIVNIVGGPNSDGVWSTSSSLDPQGHEFESPWGNQATNNSVYSLNGAVGWTSHFRMEVVKPAGSTNGQFLQVLEVSDTSIVQTEPTAASKVAGTGCIATVIGTSKMVVFADTPTVTTASHGGKTEARMNSCSFTVPTSGTFSVAVVELDVDRSYTLSGVTSSTRVSDSAAGPWTPSSGTSGDAGVLYLTVTATSGQTFTLTSSAAETDPHAYFNSLVALTQYHHLSYSLRNQTQINGLRHYTNLGQHTTYIWPNDDFADAQDAAKIIIPAAQDNYEQLRMNISIGAEFLKVQQVKALVTWDFYFDESMRTAQAGEKTFQLSRHNRNIWFETRVRWDVAPDFGVGDVRGYTSTFIAPARLGGAGAIVDGINFGSDAIAPMQNTFYFEPNKWTRFWAEVIFTAGSEYATVSYWVADEDTDVVQILDDIQMHWPADGGGVGGILNQFYIEFNTSANRPALDALGYARNVVILRDVPDPSVYFQKPIR
jgi:hypothetical protein